MKLPRWLVIAMLTTSVLSVLAAAGWWWVTWPERTLREFVQLVADTEFEEANRLMTPPTKWVIGPDDMIGPRPEAPDFLGGASSRKIWASRFQGLENSPVNSRKAVEVLVGRAAISFDYHTNDGQPRLAQVYALQGKVIDMRFGVRGW